jgi:hypothetical protein
MAAVIKKITRCTVSNTEIKEIKLRVGQVKAENKMHIMKIRMKVCYSNNEEDSVQVSCTCMNVFIRELKNFIRRKQLVPTRLTKLMLISGEENIF